ncbi:MAG: glycosyltransferase family 2 protein [bacterium]|nr:glycosyltransferase family 2 protein [bacterium]
MKLAIVIPAFNPVPLALHNVVASCRLVAPEAELLIVDDGSFPAIASELPFPITIVRHDINRGKGAALRTAFDYLTANEYDNVVTLDADGQHPPESIPDLLQKQRQTNADIVIGNRLRNSLQGMPWDRRFSNTISTKLLEWLFGVKLYDVQSGFRLIKLARWNDLQCDSDGFEFEPQLLLQAAKHHWKIEQQSIPILYDNQSSHIHRLRDTIRFLKMVWREWLHR